MLQPPLSTHYLIAFNNPGSTHIPACVRQRTSLVEKNLEYAKANGLNIGQELLALVQSIGNQLVEQI